MNSGPSHTELDGECCARVLAALDRFRDPSNIDCEMPWRRGEDVEEMTGVGMISAQHILTSVSRNGRETKEVYPLYTDKLMCK